MTSHALHMSAYAVCGKRWTNFEPSRINLDTPFDPVLIPVDWMFCGDEALFVSNINFRMFPANMLRNMNSH